MGKEDKNNSKKKVYDKLIVDDAYYLTEVPDSYKNRKAYAPLNVKELVAAIPGTIMEIFVEEGSDIEADQPLLILEAMKMRNIIKHPMDAKVKKIHVKSGDIVSKNQLLVDFE